MKKYCKFSYLFLICFVALLPVPSCRTLNNKVNTSISVSVANNSKNVKNSETVEIPWAKLSNLQNLKANNIIVKEKKTGKEIPSQVIYDGLEKPQYLIFQTSLTSGESQTFLITIGKPQEYSSKLYGRQVSERFDDFAWENDKVAFRMYGEKLEGKAGMAKGIDFWAKRTTEPVINKWYKSGNYHKDNGEGVDAYHVGITLGSGGAEPIVNGEIIYPINYSEYKILDDGPVRFTFKLIYKPFLVDGKMVKETKVISLDAGKQLNHIVNTYETSDKLYIAAGVTKHKDDGKSKMDKQNNFVAYWDQADGGIGNGFMGSGIIYPSNISSEIKETKQHLLIISKIDKKNNFKYYQGGGWSKSGNFNVEKVWFDYLTMFSKNLQTPVILKYN